MTLPHPHATLVKFGYPHNLVHEGRHWAVLVRPQQPTLGSLVLCATGEATAYGDLPPEAFAEQGELVPRIEAMLKRAVGYERINYLMLMMVDPHVHFHVIPRYEGRREFGGTMVSDSGWPGPPALAESIPVPSGLTAFLISNFR
ncbi:HIT family protein [Sphingomonas astaxanthinifaciens]|uniref:HIT family protein n=1 Tax=Sphingomonas astaxanthinifaciens DSM 22298 TaxID=1123267 RepID=A0ABQ5Z765_9SPHN|nr:HIT family protein [Sphingomonas astaxanthinifaciens]GLR48613.1 HIT family protein [Sphingomonas astaxanthinifaciens DSM 22298]